MKATFCMFFLLQKEFPKQILRDFLERESAYQLKTRLIKLKREGQNSESKIYDIWIISPANLP